VGGLVNPCGRVMDLLRSTYDVQMVFKEGDPPKTVSWFRCQEGAQLFPEPHAFFSYNWDTDFPTGTIGEQRPGVRPWNNGQGPKCARGQGRVVGQLDWFAGGQSDSIIPASPRPVAGGRTPGACCCSVPPSGRGGSLYPDSAYPVSSGCGGLLFKGGLRPACPKWGKVVQAGWILFNLVCPHSITSFLVTRPKGGNVWHGTNPFAGTPGATCDFWPTNDECTTFACSIFIPGIGHWKSDNGTVTYAGPSATGIAPLVSVDVMPPCSGSAFNFGFFTVP